VLTPCLEEQQQQQQQQQQQRGKREGLKRELLLLWCSKRGGAWRPGREASAERTRAGGASCMAAMRLSLRRKPTQGGGN